MEPPAPAVHDPLSVIDRSTVPARLLPVLDRALASAARFRILVSGRAPGPVRDRLVALSPRVDAGVLAVYDTARRAADLDAVAATLDAERVTAAYKAVRQRPSADPDLVESHRQRFASVQRVLNARDDIDASLEVVEVRLEATVARVAEVLVVSADGLDDVERDLAEVSDELGALRDGLAEVL